MLTEAEEMVSVLDKERHRLEKECEHVRTEVLRLQSMLRPIRVAAAAVLPPEIGVIDMRIGQQQERVALFDRIARSLSHREALTQEIETIQKETAALEAEVAQQSGLLEFDRPSDRIQDGMNSYLNEIKKKAPASWTQKEVKVRIEEKRFRFLVGDRKWSGQLGGTLSLYFLIAYHYALMCLTPNETCHFPGFLALDFPAELEDGSSIDDKEVFVLEPFVELLRAEAYKECQVIAASAAFRNLQGANCIELTKIWR